VVLAGVLVLAVTQFAPGPVVTPAKAMISEVRTRNIEHATEWIKTHVEPKGTVAISYYCFNPDVFYAWATFLHVPVPPQAFDGRNYRIWWGHGSVLKGIAGYACATRQDVPHIKTRI